MTLVVDLLSWLTLTGGGALVLIGGVGMLRFPDAYTRMHATGITDTLGAALVVLGLMLQAGFTLMSVKLAIVMAFLLFTSPVATHAFGQAAIRGGLAPVTDGPPPERSDAP